MIVMITAITPSLKASIRDLVISASRLEELVRPAGQDVPQQSQQADHDDHPDERHLAVDGAELLLPSHGALLKLQRALRDLSILGQMLALKITDFFQKSTGLVPRLHAPPYRRAWV